jgi:hypothetical protein
MKILQNAICPVSIVSLLFIGNAVYSADQWREEVFPSPNGGRLVFTIGSGGNPACASYDGQSCLWGASIGQIDFSKVKPLVCGAYHRQLYGATGFENPDHWCNLAQRTASAQSAPATPRTVPGTSQTAPETPAKPAGGYRMSGWSNWSRAAGVEYRYRVGWDPASSGPGKTVDAIYEVRNPGAQRWAGAARSANCEQNTLAGSTDVALGPGQTKEVRVRAPNCGDAKRPEVRPNVVRTGRFD